MRRSVLLLCLLLLAGCAGWYKIPRAEYRQRVRTLGVLPLLVDEGSVIAHPVRQGVLRLLRRHSAAKEDRLIEELKGQRGYFDVRPVAGDPRELFRRLVADSALHGKGAALSRSYRYDAAAAAALAERSVVDVLLVVVLHGESRLQKRWDRRRFNYLEASYNDVLATAAVVAPSGEVLWEYGGDEAFLPLQYPDFDEAHYNKTDAVRVRDISLAGLERSLTEPYPGVFGRATFPGCYRKLFAAIAAALRPARINLFAGRAGVHLPAAGGA